MNKNRILVFVLILSISIPFLCVLMNTTYDVEYTVLMDLIAEEESENSESEWENDKNEFEDYILLNSFKFISNQIDKEVHSHDLFLKSYLIEILTPPPELI